MKMFWLSFSGEEGFRGVVITDALTLEEAVTKTHALGINPGGEIMAIGIPMEDWPAKDRKWPKDTLISRESLQEGGCVMLTS